MKDIIYVENHHFVTVKENSIKFKNVVDKSEKFFLFDDVEAIIFDHYKNYFSHQFVVKCIENNIGVIFCDRKHSPITQVLSDYGAVNRLQRIQTQFQLFTRTKERIWKKVVTCKILNQAQCAENNLNYHPNIRVLKDLAKEVKAGDRNNREAVAARIYFQTLFGSQFKRGRFDDMINSSLNYGYAIIRSFIKHELAIHGFEMSLGIHHKSTENPFNLADDIIEVFRPFVDHIAFQMLLNDHYTEFGIEEKKIVLRVLHEKCILDKKIVWLLDAIKLMTQSLIKCHEENSPSPLLLPKMIEVGT
ncbi:type II CRISPR-associated endonuclease Cas1 [Staphylococcus auricularis]|uniref:type II CRISPR-associated endonuclease Cas1 n=1 Tax=Staphylococcus auricularis TaxID=29379 RepID=UPI00242FF02E|nr:type II CRISPR-associated endonuclease Cas1 [Staphylococcus auricularis]